MLQKLPKPSNKFGLKSIFSYYKSLNIGNKTFNFQSITEDAVLKLLEGTNTAKASGLDEVSGIFLKDGADIICTPITQLCNLSIAQCSFPNDCKTAKLKPLFKKGSMTDPKNYRPMSLLPLFSKVIERIIHDQTETFLDENNILFKFQSGFRSCHSTDTCLSYIHNRITRGFDSGPLSH